MGDVVFLQRGGSDVSREDIEQAIARRMREAREALGLTQQDLAHALGCGHEQYRKYETRSPLPIAYLQAFCTIVGVELDWLITGRDRRKPLPTAKVKGSITEFKPRAVERVM